MILFRLLAGVSLLTLGRKLYWLFVGVVGFVVAFFLVERFFPQQPEWVMLLLALLAGAVGVFLAIFLQRVAIFLAGFLVGGYLVANALAMLSWHPGRFEWVLLGVGGVVCAILAAALFDWALIGLSSLAGAMVIVQSFHLSPASAAALTAGLFLLGLALQAVIKHHEKPKPKIDKENGVAKSTSAGPAA